MSTVGIFNDELREFVATESLVAEAVEHALRLQQFFARQRTTMKTAASATVELPEAELVERMVRVQRHRSYSSTNSKPWRCEKRRYVEKTLEVWSVWSEWHQRMVQLSEPRLLKYRDSVVVSTYWAQARRCHGGVDSRRFRRGDDATGKVIGHNHRKSRSYDHYRLEFKPIAVNIYDADGIPRRIRIH